MNETRVACSSCYTCEQCLKQIGQALIKNLLKEYSALLKNKKSFRSVQNNESFEIGKKIGTRDVINSLAKYFNETDYLKHLFEMRRYSGLRNI